MKIAVVSAYAKSHLLLRLDMIKEFIARGHTVVAFGGEPEEAWSSVFAEHGVGYRSFFVNRNGVNPFEDLRTIRELTTLYEQEKPDKVFVYHSKGNIYGSIAAHRAGIDEIYAMVGGLGSVYHSSGVKNAIVRGVVSFEYKIALGYARAVFFQNDEDISLFTNKGIVDKGKVVKVHGSGVNVAQFPSRPLPESPSFVFIGRLVRGKGLLDYLEAARIVKVTFPEVEFHVVGPYDTNPTALKPEDLKPYKSDGTAIFYGEQKDVRPFLAAATCFVLPSYYGEGTPRSGLEAMATGRPLIVADAVGCREVVRNGENGFLVPPKDPGAIAEAMEQLINDPGLAERMGESSRRMAEELFDVRKVNDVICKTMGI